MKFLYIPQFLLLCLLTVPQLSWAQNRVITGSVTDAQTAKPLGGASVLLKGTVLGTVTDEAGRFALRASLTANSILLVSMVGYGRQEIRATDGQPVRVALTPSSELLDQVVVAASRVEESLLRSPVSIEKLDARAIRQSPSANYFEALNNVRGVDMVTSGLTYRQINTRGFNSTGNSRFLQLVDGVDNQSPGLGFAVGNLFGISDLDVESAELIPGSASALYGPMAFNGLLYTRTKSPFDYQGLSVQQKTGINHVADPTGEGIKPFTETSLRYAKAMGSRFAVKLNASYLKGRDWYAASTTDIDPNTAADRRGPTNPGRDVLNSYGDEVAQTLPGIGRVSRTGYAERDLTNYDVYSLKLNGAVHYRITKRVEAIYALNFSQGTANYTGSSRFMLQDFQLTQQRLELRGANFFIRGYATAENSNHSYNTRSLGQLINRTWVRDLSGNVVTPGQADATWFTRYGAAYSGKIDEIGRAHV